MIQMLRNYLVTLFCCCFFATNVRWHFLVKKCCPFTSNSEFLVNHFYCLIENNRKKYFQKWDNFQLFAIYIWIMHTAHSHHTRLYPIKLHAFKIEWPIFQCNSIDVHCFGHFGTVTIGVVAMVQIVYCLI